MASRERGIGLPVALVIAVILYFLATAMLAQSRYNLRLATGTLQATQDKYAARALVAEAIADLNLSNLSLSDLENRGPGQSLAWVEQDSFDPGLYHVRAQVGKQQFSRVIRQAGASLPLLYQVEPSGQISAFNGTDWESLPTTPFFEFSDNDGDGVPELHSVGAHPGFDPALHYQGAYADNQGRIFLIYQPYDPGSQGAAPVVLQASRDAPDSWSWSKVADLPNPQNYQALCVTDSAQGFYLLHGDGSTVEHYDSAAGSTLLSNVPLRSGETIQSLQRFFDPIGQTPTQNNREFYVETGNDVLVYGSSGWRRVDVPDSISARIHDGQSWSSPTVPFSMVKVGAGNGNGLTVFGVTDIADGDVRLFKWTESDQQMSLVHRVGERYVVQGQVQTTSASILTFDVDGSGQPFLETSLGPQQTQLYHPVSGPVPGIPGRVGRLLAAGGIAPQSGDPGFGGGSSFVSLGQY